MKFVRKVLRKWRTQEDGNKTNRENHGVIDMNSSYWKATSPTNIQVSLLKQEFPNTRIMVRDKGRQANTNLNENTISMENISFRNRMKIKGSYADEATKPPKILPKRRKEDYMTNGSFHEAIGKVLLMAEFFAMMPVRGVTTSHPRQLSFSWKSIRTWYSIIFIMMTGIDLGLAMYKVLNRSITFNNVEPLIFRSSIILVCISALNLARKWPALMQYWDKVESDLPAYKTQSEKSRMAYEIRMVTFVAMMLSLCEHILNLLATIYWSNYCPITDNPIKNFFLIANEEVFEVFEYSNWLAWLAKFENILSTFVWNYMDVFVMIISIGLTAKFRQLNDNLFKFKGMHMPESYWSERRIQYRSLCVLCDKIDNAISVITMICFSNNLYFICVQLLKSLNKMASTTHALYFYYSLFFLLGRTLAVSLYTSAINDESRRPLRVLRCVPRGSWCPEVKRFSEEISSDLVALSGMKFFHLTRNLVLSVAGTIVTYELVLIQFHEDNDSFKCNGLNDNVTQHGK